MSKKRTINRELRQRQARTHRKPRLARPILAVVIVSLFAAAAAATRWDPVRRHMGLHPISVPASPQQGNLGLSKEYIYAGGRLIVTEEPTPQPSPQGPPPTNLVAWAASGTSVNLTWTAPASGVVTGYLVERTHTVNVQPVEISTNSATPGFIDGSVSIDKAYLYRIRAVFTGGGTSDYSNKDLATTVVFTNTPLPGVVIMANHLKEARRAVNAVRMLAVPELGPSTWTYADPVSSPVSSQRAIYFEDMKELRTNLNPALSALEIIPLPEDATLARWLPVKGAHLQDVRDKVK